jgi:hypothetical protein
VAWSVFSRIRCLSGACLGKTHTLFSKSKIAPQKKALK